MPSDDVVRALDHAYRQSILRALRKGPTTYSRLFAAVEPEGSGRGRFNYHVKILREAGLVAVDEDLYRLTSQGDAALVLLEDDLGKAQPRDHWRLSDTVAGSLFGLGVMGLTGLLFVIMRPSDPTASLLPFLLVGSPFLIFLVVLHALDGFPLSSPTGVGHFIRGAVISYLWIPYALLIVQLVSSFPPLAGPPIVQRTVHPGGGTSIAQLYWLPWIYLVLPLVPWLWSVAREREWGLWRWVTARFRPT